MKKYFVFILCIMVFSLCFVCGCVSTAGQKSEYSDNEYSEYPFLTMTSDGMFNADELITWREALGMFQKNYGAIYDQSEDKLDMPIVRGEFMNYMVRAFNKFPAVSDTNKPVKYNDIADSQYKNDIDKLSAAGLLEETENGMFYPEGHMTRIEVVKFLATVSKRSNTWRETGESYKDVTPECEYYKIVMNALCGK